MHAANPAVMGANPNVGMQMMNPGHMQQPTAHMQQPSAHMQQPSPQMQQGAPMPQQQQQDKMDNISKVKTLMSELRDSIPMSLKLAAQVLHQNHVADSNAQKQADSGLPRFDKHLEEFYSLCDQMELHLRTAISCIQQSQSATHYLPLTVVPSRLDNTGAQETTLNYLQYLNTVRLQIAYAKDIHDTLVDAAQNIAPTE